jgi:broad specificity phosphatase PhoE
MMTSIYLVRHGQTAWNKEEIFRGRTDVPLDETGLKQAELAGQYFKSMEIHAIYSSPLSRAWQTAQKIAQIQMKVEPRRNMT